MGLWLGGWKSGWVGEWVCGWMGGWVDGWVGGWVSGWVWMDGWMAGHAWPQHNVSSVYFSFPNKRLKRLLKQLHISCSHFFPFNVAMRVALIMCTCIPEAGLVPKPRYKVSLLGSSSFIPVSRENATKVLTSTIQESTFQYSGFIHYLTMLSWAPTTLRWVGGW
jgi:hypothetical protein